MRGATVRRHLELITRTLSGAGHADAEDVCWQKNRPGGVGAVVQRLTGPIDSLAAVTVRVFDDVDEHPEQADERVGGRHCSRLFPDRERIGPRGTLAARTALVIACPVPLHYNGARTES